jgi:peptidyl-prolyl cis-trans isomerase C
LGDFSRGQMPPEFDEVAFTLKKGEISSVFKSSYGYHIFKLEDKREAETLSFDEAQETINQKLKAQKLDAALAGWLKKLKRDASIKINPYFLNS